MFYVERCAELSVEQKQAQALCMVVTLTATKRHPADVVRLNLQ
jgi:hypothetical protein